MQTVIRETLDSATKGHIRQVWQVVHHSQYNNVSRGFVNLQFEMIVYQQFHACVELIEESWHPVIYRTLNYSDVQGVTFP